MRISRKKTGWALSIVIASCALLQTGCKPGVDFVGAALPSLETGLNAIVDGLLDGLFAIIEPEPENQ